MDRDNFRFDSGILALPEKSTAAGKIIEMAVYLLLMLLFLSMAVSMCGYAPLSVTLAAAALVLILCFTGRREWDARAALPAILLLAAAVRIAYIFIVPTQPVSDFSLLYEKAKDAAAGDFGFAYASEGYFSWWQYQIPFVLYEAAVYRVTSSMAALKLLNVVWSVGIDYLIYRMASRFLTKRSSLLAAFMYAVYPAQIIYASVLTNQHISMFFMLLGIELLLGARTWRDCALSGAMLGFGNLMRPEAAIVVAAIVCCALCRFIERPAKKALFRTVLMLAAVLLAYFLVQKAAELILGLLGMAPYGLGNSAPEWKLVVGLNTETGGLLSDRDVAVLDISDSALRRERSLAIVKNYLDSCGDLFAFFAGKFEYFWARMEDYTFTLGGVSVWDEAVPGISFEALVSALSTVELTMRLAAYFLAAGGCAYFSVAALKKRGGTGNLTPLLTAAVLCGVVLAYLVIEIQPRYRYIAMPFVFITAAAAHGRILRKTQ